MHKTSSFKEAERFDERVWRKIGDSHRFPTVFGGADPTRIETGASANVLWRTSRTVYE